MRSRLLAFALAFIAIAALSTSPAHAQTDDAPGDVVRTAAMVQALIDARHAQAHAQAHATAGGDPDTVWFGHSWTDHTGYDGVNASSIVNYWNLYTGVNRPGTANSQNALWDFDNMTGFNRYVTDSLAGWWPIRRKYNSTGGLTLTDGVRPWWALDHGNVTNYVMNQGAGGKRTKGVVGAWHADPGRNAGRAVTWTPLAGSMSAWCGLRQHGDNSVVDQVTGQPFNAVAAEFVGENGSTTGGQGGTSKRFPGYVNQWDQMLYRDLVPASGQPLSIQFLAKVMLSKGIGTNAQTRAGWFHGDPLAVVAGNFISSSSAGANAPADSFSVYIGAPVNDAACVYSDGVTRPVYDAQRRWFSEVLRIFEAGVPYYEIYSTSGITGTAADTLLAPATVNVTVPAVSVDAIRNATGNVDHVVRLVFRVKTNYFFADDDAKANGYTSYGYGAAIVDDVTVNGTNIGDFETPEQGGANAIDNRVGASAQNNWKSTGKPPGIYFHVRALAELTYNDLCGPPDSPSRHCNIAGAVVSAGNFDDGEHLPDSRFTALRETNHSIVSPTVDLVTPAGNLPNEQGLTTSIVNTTDDIYLGYDIYAGVLNLQFQGNGLTFGVQSYPATQTANLAKCWGEIRVPSTIVTIPEPQCFSDIEGLFGNALVATSNSSGVPDSLRVWVGITQQCFRFAISLGCNSADGLYFDNLSLGFTDVPAVAQTAGASAVTLGPITSDIWQFFNDTFPANEQAGLPGTAAFDTTTALLKSGFNTAQSTGNLSRFDIPGDSLVVRAPNATVGVGDDPNLKNVRVDLVFRILPGPGNYKNQPGRVYPPTEQMQLLQLPTNQAAVVAPGDASFWGQFIANAGQFSSPNAHFGGTRWDNLTWNSARCDTLELDAFPVASGPIGFGGGLTQGNYMTTYHELDPHFATLGTNKFWCFLVDTSKAGTSTSALANVVCDGTLPAWLTTVPRSRTGWNGSVTTKEFTKILPDGLLTPGSHVQYFFRKSLDLSPTLTYAMDPDTNVVFPQTSENSLDAHRWQQFGVLPDRWKDAAFGGNGMACMLYVDLADHRGDERVWVSFADSMGGTRSFDQGNHNGWHAAGTTPAAALGVGAGSDPTIAVYGKNKQPGTLWDMYGVKASESVSGIGPAGSLGSRFANRSNMGFATGKYSRQGPTPEMLRTYYRVLFMLSGDLVNGILGPFANRSQNDIALLDDFLTATGGTARPRGILISGDGFVQSEIAAGGVDASHRAFVEDMLGVKLRNTSYQYVSGNTSSCADLITTAAITPNGDVYGIANSCTWSNDLLSRNPAVPEAVEASFYENAGVNGPYAASIRKPANPTRNWLALTEGWDIQHEFGRYCDTTRGRLKYEWNMWNNVFGSLCTIIDGFWFILDTPGTTQNHALADYMRIRSSVLHTRATQVHLGLTHPDRVKVRLYDVGGRLVRTLADRSFAAGEYDLVWDGADDAGHAVARGVYFARVEYATKGVIGTGRVVVLR